MSSHDHSVEVAGLHLIQANDFSSLLKTYIDGLQTPKVKSLSELIAFNEEHSNLELPPDQYLRHSRASDITDVSKESPGQEKLIQSEKEANRLSKDEYQRLENKTTAAGREHGIDKVLREHNVDVITGRADSRIPDVCALASRSLALHDPEYFETDISRRIPIGDASTWVPRLEWQTLWPPGSCLSIPKRAFA